MQTDKASAQSFGHNAGIQTEPAELRRPRPADMVREEAIFSSTVPAQASVTEDGPLPEDNGLCSKMSEAPSRDPEVAPILQAVRCPPIKTLSVSRDERVGQD